MKTLPIDYKEYTVNTSVLLIDPPWKYDDHPKSTQIHQVTYGVWENEEGLDWIFSQPVGPRTQKPKEWEVELCRLLNDRGRSVTYVFSGPCVDVFNEFDNMICVDTCFKDENNHL